jgi:hypothetical protein
LASALSTPKKGQYEGAFRTIETRRLGGA